MKSISLAKIRIYKVLKNNIMLISDINITNLSKAKKQIKDKNKSNLIYFYYKKNITLLVIILNN